jgi:hypothetical protein
MPVLEKFYINKLASAASAGEGLGRKGPLHSHTPVVPRAPHFKGFHIRIEKCLIP